MCPHVTNEYHHAVKANANHDNIDVSSDYDRALIEHMFSGTCTDFNPRPKSTMCLKRLTTKTSEPFPKQIETNSRQCKSPKERLKAQLRRTFGVLGFT